MAIIQRKLFPTTNQTVNCQHNCDPTCPYGCYPYPDYFFFPQPPPPPPRVMAEPSKSHSGINLSPHAIVLITFTAAFFLIIGYYVIFTRRCLRPRSSTSSNVDEEFIDENRGPMIDNPIWYITTIGLQPSVINSITVVKYSKTSGLIDGTDCSVCLNEFQEDETLRLLPCNHAFHIMCIDTWLRSHTNCPLCRCGILSNTPVPLTQAIDNNSSSDLLNQVTTELAEIQQHDEDTAPNQTEEQSEPCEIHDHETKSNGFWVVDIDETEDDMHIPRINKSFSMNSPSSILHLGVECEGSTSSNSRILYKMMSGSLIRKSLHKRPVLMKRSFSYSGRSFIWRHYRNHKAMVRLRNVY